MIDFELFTRLYSEAKQYDDIDLFTSERGWQDWMDNFFYTGSNIYTQ